MAEVVTVSREDNERAIAAIEAHHHAMGVALAAHAETIRAEAAEMGLLAAERAREALVDWCHAELLPHASAEERVLYPVAGSLPGVQLLIEAMTAEHRLIADLVHRLEEEVSDPVSAAVVAGSLQVTFVSHVAKENDLLLPLLAGSGVSVRPLLDDMHELFGTSQRAPSVTSGCTGHGCGCSAQGGGGFPELDARQIPHELRIATIFGVLESVDAGAGLVLVAPHDPARLLEKIGHRWPDAFDVAYLESGPDAWRLALTRRAA